MGIERLRTACPDGLPSVVLEGCSRISVTGWRLSANQPVQDESARVGGLYLVVEGHESYCVRVALDPRSIHAVEQTT